VWRHAPILEPEEAMLGAPRLLQINERRPAKDLTDLPLALPAFGAMAVTSKTVSS